MKHKLKIKTPAKINLSLEILNKLPNGYHSLSTIMQAVSLYDFLTIEVSEKIGDNEIILDGNNKNIPYNEKNIVYKVLDLYLEKTKLTNKKINIYIEKNIPQEAGLAGGSTNGAGALVGINEICNNLLSNEEIHTIAAKVGSDLNFCLIGGVCLLSSRGEIIEEKLPHRDYNILLAKPKNISVSTPQCYKDFSSKYFKEKEAIYSKKIQSLFKTDFSITELSRYLYNDLEKPAISIFPELQKIKDLLISFGCQNALMSGSGSSVFGLYEKEIDLKENKNIDFYFVKPVSDACEII